MKINRKLRCDNDKVNAYIGELEDELLKKENSSIQKFIIASNKVAKVFAEDLELLAEGRIDQCKLLNSDKDDKTVDRIMLMMKNNELFLQISNTADQLPPEIVDEVQDLKLKLTEEDSTFEQMQKRVKEKKNADRK